MESNCRLTKMVETKNINIRNIVDSDYLHVLSAPGLNLELALETELANLSADRLRVMVQGLTGPDYGGPGPGPAAEELALRLYLPGLSQPGPDSLALTLKGYSLRHRELVHLDEDVMQRGQLISLGSGSRLDYVFDPAGLGDSSFYRLVVRLTLPDAEPRLEVFDIFSRRRDYHLRQQWRAIEPVDDSEIGTWRKSSLSRWQPEEYRP